LVCRTVCMEPKRKIERFEDLIVWQKALVLSKEIYRITSDGMFSKDWGLRDQIRRVSVSILSNIAEGFGKYSSQEFKKYLTNGIRPGIWHLLGSDLPPSPRLRRTSRFSGFW
jgi:hypothetical protein